MADKIVGYHMVKIECQGAGRIAIDGELANKLMKWIDGRTGFNISEGDRNFVIHAQEMDSEKQFDLFYNLGEYDGTTIQFPPEPDGDRPDSQLSNPDNDGRTEASPAGSSESDKQGMGSGEDEVVSRSESDNGIPDGKSAAAGESANASSEPGGAA